MSSLRRQTLSCVSRTPFLASSTRISSSSAWFRASVLRSQPSAIFRRNSGGGPEHLPPMPAKVVAGLLTLTVSTVMGVLLYEGLNPIPYYKEDESHKKEDHSHH